MGAIHENPTGLAGDFSKTQGGLEVAGFYRPLCPAREKRGGAWMDELCGHGTVCANRTGLAHARGVRESCPVSAQTMYKLIRRIFSGHGGKIVGLNFNNFHAIVLEPSYGNVKSHDRPYHTCPLI